MPSLLIKDHVDPKISFISIEDDFVTYTITINFRALVHAKALKDAFKLVNTAEQGIYYNNEPKSPDVIVISGNIFNAFKIIDEKNLIAKRVIDYIYNNEEILRIISASRKFDFENVRMQHHVMTYLKDSKRSPQLCLNLCHLLNNPDTDKVNETNEHYIRIKNYLADQSRAAMMKKIILENMLPDEIILDSDPLLYINDIPALLTAVYRHSRDGSLDVTFTHFSTFTAKNLKKIFAAAKLVGVKTTILNLDSNIGIGRDLLYFPAKANIFSEVMSADDFSFDVLKFGCKNSIVSAEIDKTAWIQIITSANFKVLHAGISLDSKKIIPFLAGISAAKALTALQLAACDLHLLRPADWILFFETLKVKGIQSLEMTFNQPLFKTERLMDAFLTGLAEARITHLVISAWPGYEALDDSQKERIFNVVNTNKIALENPDQQTSASVTPISSHPFFRPATLNIVDQVPAANCFSP